MLVEIGLLCGGLFVGTKLYGKIGSAQNKRTVKIFDSVKNYMQPEAKNGGDENKGRGAAYALRKAFNLPTDDPDSPQKTVHRPFVVGCVSLGFAVGGTLIYSPLLVVSTLGICYNLVPFWYGAYESLFKNRRVNVAVIDAIVVSGLLAMGSFFNAAFVNWVFFTGQRLVFRIKDISRERLAEVFSNVPASVWVLQDDVEVAIPLDEVKAGDIVVVNAGGIIPVDGVVTEGIATVDQHILTGEFQPLEKETGARVFASTIVLSGKICIVTYKSGQETVASKIGEILNNITEYKSSLQSRGEEVADKVALPTMILSAVTMPFYGYASGLAILYSFIGDSMRIIAPVSTLNFFRVASDNSIMIKDGRSFELLNNVDAIVFDKTGTLTLSEPHVGKVYALDQYGEDDVLRYAAIAESRQLHPIAKAILGEAVDRGLDLPESIADGDYQLGYGIRVDFSEQPVRVGSPRFMELEGIALGDDAGDIIDYAHRHGHTLIMVAVGDRLAGAVELHATIRPEAKGVIDKLRQQNISMYIMSGDHAKPTEQLANELGIVNYFAEVLPENKGELIEKLRDEGKTVCFVGDGINDSIALKRAHVSVSLSGASTIATDTAQIILMDGTLNSFDKLFEIGGALEKNLKVDFISTIVPGLITIGGVLFLHMGVNFSTLMYATGLTVGFGNSMLPLLRYRKKLSDAAEPPSGDDADVG